MDFLIIALFLGVLLVCMFAGAYIGVAMGVTGLTLIYLKDVLLAQGIGRALWNTANSYEVIAAPLFIFMGELILQSGLISRLYRGVTVLLRDVPGRLVSSNIVVCAFFSAITGSSMACAATVGTVAIPEMLDKRQYDRRFTFGSLASGGTLGILIPPSVPLIIYGAYTGTSVGRLFIAGVLPGITLALLFLVYIMIRALLQPNLVPALTEAEAVKRNVRTVASSLLDILPTVLMIGWVFSAMYLGIATPVEAAGVAASGAIVLVVAYRRFRWTVLKKAAEGTIITTTMILFLYVNAQLLTYGMAVWRIPEMMTLGITSLVQGVYPTVALLVGVFLVLGCFIDPLPMMLLTLPVTFPLITSLGLDPIWFGIMNVIFMELCAITPPVGINLFVIHGVAGADKYSLNDVLFGSLPYVLLMLILALIVVAFPPVSLWLPSKMMG